MKFNLWITRKMSRSREAIGITIFAFGMVVLLCGAVYLQHQGGIGSQNEPTTTTVDKTFHSLNQRCGAWEVGTGYDSNDHSMHFTCMPGPTPSSPGYLWGKLN